LIYNPITGTKISGNNQKPTENFPVGFFIGLKGVSRLIYFV